MQIKNSIVQCAKTISVNLQTLHFYFTHMTYLMPTCTWLMVVEMVACEVTKDESLEPQYLQLGVPFPLPEKHQKKARKTMVYQESSEGYPQGPARRFPARVP
jgi:hypothetical protein